MKPWIKKIVSIVLLIGLVPSSVSAACSSSCCPSSYGSSCGSSCGTPVLVTGLAKIRGNQETIKIENNTVGALNVDFTLPEKTLATIQLTKIKQLSQVNTPHASITGWKPGSYDQIPGILVRIDFDQSPTDKFVDNFSNFLIKSLNSSSGINHQNGLKNSLEIIGRLQKFFSIMIQPSITREQLQTLIDQANHHMEIATC